MTNTSGWPGTLEVGPDDDLAARSGADAERGRERVGLHARGPHHGAGRDHGAVGELAPVAASTDAIATPSTHLDARAAPARRFASARERGENVPSRCVGHLDQHDPRPADVEALEVLRAAPS